ncbi:MAG: formylglycine-generating enzyme family protein [Phycisphaerales bacterium]|nr:formylglycine-generating enzyme family protein [Phycisphaerales bacterium]
MTLIAFASLASSAAAETSFKAFNRTSRTAEFWIDGTFVGAVPAASSVVFLNPPRDAERQKKGNVSVIVVSADAEAYWLNGIIFGVTEGQSFEVVWGGIDAGEGLKVVEQRPAATPTFEDIAKARWQTLAKLLPGQPSPFATTLIGTEWNGKPVNGEVLAISNSTKASFANSIGMLFVRIRAGSFVVATTGNPAGRGVTLTRDFYMAVTEASNAQVARGLGTSHTRVEAADHPRAMITWAKANEFCEQLTDVPGFVYRLPSEAQWEYACQAGRLAPYSPAVTDINRIAWTSKNSGGVAHPVGQLLPNDYGLYDMHGNVREWCRSWWSFTPPAGTDPEGPATGKERVRRGGSFQWHQGAATSGLRDASPPDLAHPTQGFRMILEVAPPAKPSTPEPSPAAPEPSTDR